MPKFVYLTEYAGLSKIIVNLDAITTVDLAVYGDNTTTLTMINGKEVVVSESQADIYKLLVNRGLA